MGSGGGLTIIWNPGYGESKMIWNDEVEYIVTVAVGGRGATCQFT